MNFEKNNGVEKEKFSPEVRIGNYQDVQSSVIWYSIFKKLNNMWGGEQNEYIAEKIRNIDFEVSDDIEEDFKELLNLADDNEETLKWLAIVVEKDEASKLNIIEQIVRYKNMDKEQAEELSNSFNDFYHKIKSSIDAIEISEEFIESDIESREKDMPELMWRIDEAINFFNPINSEISEVVYLPTNPLEKKQSGNGTVVNNIAFINSEKGNRINQVHEFLHCIINPIIDKLTLSSDEERKILAFCSDNLKKQEYVSASSILTEEIIRTYKTGFNPSDRLGFDGFMNRLLSTDDLEGVIDFKKEDLESKNVDEFLKNKNDIRKYYDKYIKNILSERIWDFFREYSDQNIYNNFEEYFLNNYKRILAD